MLTARAGSSNQKFEELVNLVVMLHQGEVDLDELASEIKNKKLEGADCDSGIRSREVQGKITSKKRCLTAAYDQEIVAHEKKSIKKVILKKGLNPRGGCKRIKRSITFTKAVPPLLTEEIKKQILDFGGAEESIVFVIEKKLFTSDIDPGQGRFSIPYGQVNPRFLEKLFRGEVALMDAEGIPVNFFGAGGRERVLRLKNWESNSSYTLIHGWNEVCHDSRLEKGESVQLWSFRRNEKLCFSLF